MTRRCSHCGHNGHNSRTCPNRGVKLFGVRLTDGSIRKSASMGNLSHYTGSLANGSNSPSNTPDHGSTADGYTSEDFVPGSSTSRERKKGTPWTEDEHRMFLLGLQKLGKGDWRGIARSYVMSRTPTQVASHAQKYFIRQTNVSRRKRRSSLFDIVADESLDTPMESQDFYSVSHPLAEGQNENPLPPVAAAAPPPPPPLDDNCESMHSTNSNDNDEEPAIPKPEGSQPTYPVIYPTYFSPFFPYSVPFWPGFSAEPPKTVPHEVLKPTAVHSKSPINVDELIGMSKLSLGESIGNSGSSALSLKLHEGSSRQSAFHANPASNTSGMNSSGSPIHAV
ncbi:syringolide-induced protein 1-3-1B [Tripterygium wilfordii]|uniref:Syringolide-induced protein 1-3-1B n=1 Tax=Tripterygium wilfordii TaxID=458696 RepID=A0A7J7C7K9_TRIWF|nr:transcription factor MYBS3-like [Tripterygium wilfordii]KAF5729827.1 syringolide-induced protein 1-3-1B [Tripterygium wilfordii]